MQITWQSIIFNGILAIIGYMIGSISWSIILSWKIHNEDIRIKGSGNAGATNTTRSYGVKEGLVVFFLDTSKVVCATIVAWSFKHFEVFGSKNDVDLIVQIAPFMAFVGHIYPLWHKFKGGKGVACFFGFCLSFNIIVAIICVLTFSFIAFKWKMISLASVITPAIIFCISWVPWFQTGVLTFFFKDNAWWISSFFLFLIAGIIVLKHIPNIKRIIAEQESTIKDILKK